MKSCVASAPSSTSSLEPSYDVFGLALEPLKDRVEITKGSGKVNRISLKTLGEGQSSIPLLWVSSSKGWPKVIKHDLTVTVVKGIPKGSGIVGHTLGKLLKK